MYLSQAAPALYALAIEAAGSSGVAALELCRDCDVLGVGWGVGALTLDWDGYQRRAIARDGALHPAVLEIHDLPDGALIWTRDPAREEFYLAQVVGPWRYIHSPDALRAGIQNVRPVRMLACDSVGQVPRTIVNRFRGEWAIQRIYDEHTARRSASLFAKLSDELDRSQLTLDDILAGHLSDQQVRDVVCQYLHERCGYTLTPSLRAIAGSWEYILDDGSGGTAIVRARRGFSLVPRRTRLIPAGAVDRIFVFSPTGSYGPGPDPNVTEIRYEEIVEFVRELPAGLPRALERPLAESAPVR